MLSNKNFKFNTKHTCKDKEVKKNMLKICYNILYNS